MHLARATNHSVIWSQAFAGPSAATLTGPALLIAASSVAGVVYMARVVGRARSESTYTPVLEDWIWYVAVPVAAYLTLIVGAALLPSHATPAMFIVGAVLLLLLFLGIRNAWDTVVYIAAAARERTAGKSAEPASTAEPGSRGSCRVASLRGKPHITKL